MYIPRIINLFIIILFNIIYFVKYKIYLKNKFIIKKY